MVRLNIKLQSVKNCGYSFNYNSSSLSIPQAGLYSMKKEHKFLLLPWGCVQAGEAELSMN